jgi:AcrR family transcriptional regulator
VTEETELDESRPSRPHGKRVRRNIIDAARALFAEKGYSGAKVEEIVVRARTTKPMIYYYFGSKERLFGAVLEDVYAGMRTIEQLCVPKT